MACFSWVDISDFWLAAYFFALVFFIFILNFDYVRVLCTLLDFLTEVFFLISVLLCFFWISKLLFWLLLCTLLCWLNALLLFIPSLCTTPIMIHYFQSYPKWTFKSSVTCLLYYLSNCSLDKSQSWQTWSEQACYITRCTNFCCKQVNFPNSINAAI